MHLHSRRVPRKSARIEPKTVQMLQWSNTQWRRLHQPGGFAAKRSPGCVSLFFGLIGVFFGTVLAQAQPNVVPGIPVTDSLVKAKCAGCHPSDDQGNMKRISWERATPEGW